VDDEELAAATMAVTAAMATAFQELWLKPNAAQVMEDFLAGRARFLVAKDGIATLLEQEGEPGPSVGLYL
jgi:hypothetical protein